MDVFQISGLKFRMLPNLTVRMILDVFEAAGRQGLIQKNGVVEYSDTVIDVVAGSQYEFLATNERFSRNNVTFAVKDKARELYRLENENIALGINKQQLYPLQNENMALGTNDKEFYSLGNENTKLGTNNKELYLLGNDNIALGTRNKQLYPLGNENITLGTNEGELYPLLNDNIRVATNDKQLYPLGNGNILVGTNNKEVYSSLNQWAPLIKGNEALVRNNAQSLYPLNPVSNFRTQFPERQLFPISTVSLAREDIAITTPDSYTVIEVRAAHKHFLFLNQIEVYHKSGFNISAFARVESSDVFAPKLVNGMIGGEQNMLRNIQRGEWFRLRFENRSGLSNIVMRSNLNQAGVDTIQSVRGANLTVKSIDEYILNGSATDYQFINAYAEDLIDVIEIDAQSADDLPMQGLKIISNEGTEVRPVKTKTLLYFNPRPLMEVILPQPTLIKSITLLGTLKDVKLTLQQVKKFTCSEDVFQRFHL